MVMIQKKCDICGYTITCCGTVGTQNRYNGKIVHKNCLERLLVRQQKK